MKILHAADLHLWRRTRENVEHALDQILDLVHAHKPDALFLAGDLFQKAGSVPNWAAERMRRFVVAVAAICPVVIVPGNHDIVSTSDDVSAVRGTLGLSERSERVLLAEQPCVLAHGRMTFLDGSSVRLPGSPTDSTSLHQLFNGLPVACLPYPDRAWLASRHPEIGPSEFNARASEMLEDAVRALAVLMPGPGLLVFHGSIDGAKTGTEQEMRTENDIVLRASAIPDVFQAVLCGHIHKHQVIGRAVYAGSPCPLDHGEENHPHGVVLWDSDCFDPHAANGRSWGHRFIALEPKHRLLTVDLRELAKVFPVDGTEQAIHHVASSACPADYRGAHVRVLATLPRGASVESIREGVEQAFVEFGEAASVSLTIEREPEDRSTDSSTVSLASTLADNLDAYIDRNPDTHDFRAELHALAPEIEGAIPAEARAQQRLGDFRIVAWEAQDFKSLGRLDRLEVGTLGQVTDLSGPNGSGKSNTVEALIAAIWGPKATRSKSLAGLVRIGADEMRVSAEFEAQGTLYRVRRTVRLNGKGEGEGKVYLERWYEERFLAELGVIDISHAAWEPCSNGNAHATEAQIKSLVGTLKEFTDTCFIQQGEVARVLSMTPSEFKDALQSAIGTGMYEHMERCAVERAAAAKDEALALEAQARVLEERAAGLDAARAAVGDAEAAVQAQAEVIERSKAAIGTAEAEVTRLRQEVAEAEKIEERRTASQKRLEAIEERGADLVRDRMDCESAIEEAAAAQALIESNEADAAECRRLGERWEEGEDARRAKRDAETALNNASEAFGEAKATGTLALNDLTRTQARWIERLTKASERRTREREQHEANIAAERKRSEVVQTPFGEECVTKACPLLAIPIAARANLVTLEAQLKALILAHDLEAAADIAERDLEIEAAQKRADEAAAVVGRASKAADDARAIYHRACAAVEDFAATFDVAHYGRLRDKVNGFDVAAAQARVTAGAEARGRLQSIDAELERLTKEAEEVERELGEFPADAVMQAFADHDEACKVLRNANLDLEGARRVEMAALQQLAADRARLQQHELDAQAAENSRGKRAEMQRIADVARIFASAMGRDGIPYMLLERERGAFERHCNFFLGEGNDDLRVEVELTRGLRDGTEKSEVVVRYRDRFGLHELAAASGYQSGRLGVALRVAMAKIQAESHGRPVRLLILDEAVGVYDDADNVMGAQQMVRRLPEGGWQVLHISHIPALKEIADTRLSVVPDAVSGSTVERAS